MKLLLGDEFRGRHLEEATPSGASSWFVGERFQAEEHLVFRVPFRWISKAVCIEDLNENGKEP